VARFALSRDFRKLKSLLSSADSVVAMVDQLLDWALECGQRTKGPKDKVFYLGAHASADDVKSCDGDPWSHLAGKFVVTYVGTFGRYNNPSVLIDAARLLQQRSRTTERFAFVIAGDGVLHSKAIEAASGVEGMIFPGWLDAGDLTRLLQSSTVAVLPWSSPAAAFPNKAFHYLHAGLPVAASVSGELRKLLLDYNAGGCFESGGSAQLAELLERWLNDPALVETMARNARRLATERLDASRIYAEFATHIEDICNCH
jgi:glycosyltransferase involved in cell wall biosynthesis